jgi:hypothetical protein
LYYLWCRETQSEVAIMLRSLPIVVTLLLSAGPAFAECLADDESDVRLRVQSHITNALGDVCGSAPDEEIAFHYFGTWSTEETDLRAQQAITLEGEESDQCLTRLVERLISDGESRRGPSCSQFIVYKTEWLPNADSGPSFLFYMSSSSEIPSATTISVSSTWKNQRGSVLEITDVSPDGTFQGTFVNNAPGSLCIGTPYAVKGSADAPTGSVRFEVSFTGDASVENCFTVTAWRGQLVGGTIETNWSLAYASGDGDLRVIGGSDTFTKQP